MPLDTDDANLALATLNLSADERERAKRFQNDWARRRFVTTRAALRTILARYLSTSPLDIDFAVDASGKPRLGGKLRSRNRIAGADGLRFNVAHSGGLALIAVALNCEIGVDVEQLRTVNWFTQIAGRYFHPLEVAALLAEPPSAQPAAFLRCWTSKEAVLKAVGVGITGPLDRFQVPLRPQHGTWIECETASGHVRCWLESLLLGSDYVGAVACLNEQRCVTLMSRNHSSNESGPTMGRP
ncbi:MAG: 4'-phosphopantetheinyl transferase superfamily protein [Pirellulales bacterium]